MHINDSNDQICSAMFRLLLFIIAGSVIHTCCVHAQEVTITYHQQGSTTQFLLANDVVNQRIVLQDDMLTGDVLSPVASDGHAGGIQTDAGFQLQLMWTGWSAPGKYFNGDLHVTLTAKDFRFDHADTSSIADSGKALALYFTAVEPDNPLLLRITYSLLPGRHTVCRQIAVCDTTGQDHWLEAVLSREGVVEPREDTATPVAGVRIESSMHVHATAWQPAAQQPQIRLIKKGEFGQPCAADFPAGGVFFGIEYPAGVNQFQLINDRQLHLECKEWIGQTIGRQWVNTHPVVEGLAPDHRVHLAFDAYLRNMQVAPDTPYLLYNSWYDLRSPAFTDISPDHVMNEKNILRIIHQFKQNMVMPYGIHLDAFVLDDGWDTYASDWQLRTSTFPHGLTPIIEALKPLHTRLGIWIGPTGGYSFRMERINWLRAHGYETVGHGNHIMMDIAGPKYFGLLEKRLTDFARMGVGYFKWDGMQFSSSEPDNHHPVGYFSEITALRHIIQLADTVRKINSGMYINMTSGTWMSPWWLKYANQIWMQGADYGYATLPAYADRDAAMTYKDMVLYDDFRRHDVWFPMSHVMTHGIIKARLASVGADDDPLDVFANDVVLYFGRGVTMYEWYISPDMLQPDEWRILSQGLQWAKAHAPLLRHTYMVGGDPARGEAYGYVHLQGDSGILVIRNPQIHAQQIEITLDPALGLDPHAANLVVERMYPDRWIAPQLYSAGGTITFPLKGYETAVYHIFPLHSAHRPLLANAVFRTRLLDSQHIAYQIVDTTGPLCWLNPAMVGQVAMGGQTYTSLDVLPVHLPGRMQPQSTYTSTTSQRLQWQIDLPDSIIQARYVCVLYADSSVHLPDIQMRIDDHPVKPIMQSGFSGDTRWWVASAVIHNPGWHRISLQVDAPEGAKHASVQTENWLFTQIHQPGIALQVHTTRPVEQPVMPPAAYPDAMQLQQALGDHELGW